MPKRHGNLWDKLVSRENLELAYKRAVKGRSAKKSVIRFNQNKEANLEAVRQSLINKTFTTAKYAQKKVFEPKERTIHILPFCPDRIVQHALMNVLIPIYEKLFIRDSYACIAGRGIHSGSARTMEFMRRNNFCLKCDVSKFYPSIPHDRLKAVVRRKIKDKNVLWLVDDIIDSFPGERNIPIGNFCSQWFGNLYLNELDTFVKRELKCRDYIRYCDDFILFSTCRATIGRWASQVRDFLLGRMGLALSKCSFIPLSRGLDFLGYRHFRRHVLLRKSTVRRMSRRMPRRLSKYLSGAIGFPRFQSSVASMSGWFVWAKTHNLSLRLRLKPIISFIENERVRLGLASQRLAKAWATSHGGYAAFRKLPPADLRPA